MHPRVLIIALLVLGLLRYAWLAQSMHPYADDWSYAATAFDEPFSDRLVHEYRSWNGRLASNILVLRGPLVLGLERGLPLYRALPLTWIALMVMGWTLLIRSLGPWGPPRSWAFPGALLITTLWLNTLPDLTEGLYWYTGTVTYTLPNLILLFIASAALRSTQAANRGQRVLWSMLVVVPGLWAAWSSEVHLVILVVAVAVRSLFLLRRDGHLPGPLWALAALSAMAALVLVLAPGNATRAAHFPLRGDLINTLAMGGLQTLRFLLAWILSPAICAASFLWLVLLRRTKVILLPGLDLRALVVALVGTVFVIMAMPYWATGLLGQHRTVNVAFFLFLPLWALVIAAVERDVLRPANSALPRHRALVPVLSGFLVLSLLLGGNDGRVASDLLSDAAARSDSTWTARYAEVRKAAVRGGSSVTFTPMVAPPVAIRTMEPDTAPDHWTNTSLARYLGAPGVRITGPPAN
jgi:hypothetical protein